MKRLVRLFCFFIGTPTLLVSLAGTASANATDCFPSEMGRTPSDPADAPLWRKAMEVAGIPTSTCGVALREWPHERDTYVLYAENPVEYNVMDHRLLLLRKKGDSFEVLARHHTAENPYFFQSFDFAPYSIRKGEVAIGVRLQVRGPTIGGGYQCSRLVLFARVEGELNPIFSAIAKQSAEGNEVAYEEETRYERSSAATFVMGKPDRSGYKRIVRKSGKAKTLFSWHGSSYTTQDDGDAGCLGDWCYCQDEYK
jgi:hypothetical protein